MEFSNSVDHLLWMILAPTLDIKIDLAGREFSVLQVRVILVHANQNTTCRLVDLFLGHLSLAVFELRLPHTCKYRVCPVQSPAQSGLFSVFFLTSVPKDVEAEFVGRRDARLAVTSASGELDPLRAILDPADGPLIVELVDVCLSLFLSEELHRCNPPAVASAATVDGWVFLFPAVFLDWLLAYLE